MQGRLVIAARRVALMVLLTVALVATGFGHRMPSGTDTAIEAYVLAGGTAADLCGSPGDEGTLTQRDCPACQIVGAAALPDAPASIIQADLVFVATVIAPRESRALQRVLDPGRGMRAPPLA